MNRSHVTVAGIACLLLLAGQTDAYEIHSTKKGVGQTAKEDKGYNAKIQKDRVEALNCSWYYTWGINTRNDIMDPAIEFVPMKWGGNQLPGNNTMTEDLATLFTPAWTGFAPVTHLLGFNEPEHAEQSNVSVTQALAVWPLLEEAAATNGILNIGSPACSGANGQDGQWVTNFMTQAISQGLQVDFMTFHRYPEPISSVILNDAATYDSRYGKDVWITEFNAADWNGTNDYTLAETYTWMAELLYRLESTPYIKRYAIFPWDAADGEQAVASDIFEIDVPSPGVTNRTDTLTPLGKLYANYRSADTNGPYPGVTYYLHNRESHERLFFAGTGNTSTTNIYTEGSAVDFRLVDAGNNRWFIFKNDGSNKRLGYTDQVSFYWSTNATGYYTQWSLADAANGWKYISHAGTGKRLGTSGSATLTMGSAAAGSDAYQWAFIRSNTASDPWTELVSDDFESGWGSWIDGGFDAFHLTSGYANGSKCVLLRDDSGDDSSIWLDSALDLTGYSRVRLECTFMPISMETGEDLQVQFSDDGGTTWTLVKSYVSGTNFINSTRDYAHLILDSGSYNFTTNVKFRVQCDASADNDEIYLDDVVISGYAEVVEDNVPFFLADTTIGADAAVDVAYSSSIAFSAADLDNDPLTYWKTGGPAWLNIATNGSLSGTPAWQDVGTNSFAVQVSDGNGGSDTATLNIQVTFATVLVGGSTLNGDFNNPDSDSTFLQLTNWVNLGTGGQTMNATKNNNAYDGSRHAVAGYLPGSKVFGLDTGYSIDAGDSFDISYVWKDGYLWEDGSDRVRVSLFVTSDNTLTGTRTNLVQDLSELSILDNTYESVDHDSIYTASETDADRTLFVAIDTTISDEGYAPLDNFELIVSQAAEPGYDAWRTSYNMSGTPAATTNDYDLDGWNNLLEYGLNGDPTNGLTAGTAPVLGEPLQEGGTNWIEYIHLQRTNANHGLTYTLEQTQDLISQPWSNCVDAVISGTGPASHSDFMMVTNRIPMDGKPQEFIRLRIDN